MERTKKKVAKGGDDIGKLDGGVEKLWGQVRKEQVHSTELVWAYEWGSYRSYHTVSMILAQATLGPKQPSWGNLDKDGWITNGSTSLE